MNACYAGGRVPTRRSHRRDLPTELMAAHRRVHQIALQRAKRFAEERRGDSPTGVHAALVLLRAEPHESCTVRRAKVPQVTFLADRIDEPRGNRVVNMLAALPPEEAAYYAKEEHVVDWCGKSTVQLEELEAHYGFFGGSYTEWVGYLCRTDLPKGMWTFARRSGVKAVAGVTAVWKKAPQRQRKLIMACPANFVWEDARHRCNHGLGGGGALTALRTMSESLAVAAMAESNAFSVSKKMGCASCSSASTWLSTRPGT